MDPELLTALTIDKVTSTGLLLVACWLLWRRYAATSDRLVAELKAQTTEVTAKLGELKASLEAGLAGLRGQVDRLDRQVGEHQRRLDRHSGILRAVGSGAWPRVHVVGEDE
ncbi:MAG TPA: hypothetical protein VIK91_20550 [Nannocystis sp.]